MINQPTVAPVLQAEVLANIEQFGLPAKNRKHPKNR